MTIPSDSAGRPGGVRGAFPRTLVEALWRARGTNRWGLAFMQPDLSVREREWSRIADEAERRAAQLLGLGLTKGARVGLFTDDEEPFAVTFFGAVLAGLLPVPMSPPSPLGRAEVQMQRVAAILASSGASCVIGPASMAATLASLPKLPALQWCCSYEELAQACVPKSPRSPVDPAPDDVCFLQYTSGSTSSPKGVQVSHRNLVANTAALHQLLDTDLERVVGVTWVPLSHDMGLIGTLITATLVLGRYVLIPAMAFAVKPQIWLETIDRYRAVVTTANNFALRAAIKKLPEVASLDLSSLRAMVIGGEPIHPGGARSFVDALRPYGLSECALCPAYGMAEATLAISTSGPGESFETLSIDRALYERHGEVRVSESPDAMTVVDCGRVLPGHEVVIVDAQSRPLPPGRVGEIHFRGPSVSLGYFENPAATEAAFTGEWLRTGDFGFLHDNRLYVSGRVKDLIIIAGRNHYPQDIEWVASQVSGVRSHHVIAFSVPGGEDERLVVLAECAPGADPRIVQGLIREAIVRELGVHPFDILVVEPRSLPQTSSGKPRRSQAREDYLNRQPTPGARPKGSATERE